MGGGQLDLEIRGREKSARSEQKGAVKGFRGYADLKGSCQRGGEK